ncbi:hypothetical protein SLEP1_g55943 [Rubroshorea leprosula]|uniref:non-specific serine/threonine protein kinase n=1 Tax=Rubroshorea leprosula TaxID=152421 RepID=A0AAV5MH42_9ROSI|nr:hypothetical protein SLEP1_g55943 [Rubroshorea leprosula]
MGRLIRFSQILCLSFMLLQFRVQSSSPSQSSLDSPPHLCRPEERAALLDFTSTINLVEDCFGGPRPIIQTWSESKTAACGRASHATSRTVIYNYELRGNFLGSNWSSLLKYFYLTKTSFLGELPHSIGKLKLLEELNLNSCQFYGSIPRSLANLTKITYLDFDSNLLQGQIPDVFRKMHKLTHLSLLNNSFGGEIPTSIFNLTDLTHLTLSSNKLIGPLPHYISGLSFLQEFRMDNNFIKGRIPSWLFSLPSSSFLDLRNNRLTRPIDNVEMSNLILQEVDLSNNEISGSFPSSFFHLVNLARVDLSSNNLSGTITPEMLSKLVDLRYLDLSNNSLLSVNNNDTSVYYSFPNLSSLRFSSCNILKFPSFLRKAESLLHLDISKNNISGQIHKWEIEGMSLYTLNLSYNFLTGIDSFGFGNLEIVDLRSNLLQGSLPILSATWDSMQQLFISENNLTGEIPSSYCNLTSLIVLDLANNNLG